MERAYALSQSHDNVPATEHRVPPPPTSFNDMHFPSGPGGSYNSPRKFPNGPAPSLGYSGADARHPLYSRDRFVDRAPGDPRDRSDRSHAPDSRDPRDRLSDPRDRGDHHRDRLSGDPRDRTAPDPRDRQGNRGYSYDRERGVPPPPLSDRGPSGSSAGRPWGGPSKNRYATNLLFSILVEWTVYDLCIADTFKA